MPIGDLSLLSDAERAVVEEEQRWLCRLVRASDAAAMRRSKAGRKDASATRDELRALREQAIHSSEEDLPDVLHELGVRQQLAARTAEALPDPNVPYLAHLAVVENNRRRDYLLGQVNLFDGELRLVDWRVAPIAAIYYGYREGDEYELEFPGRVAEGEVIVRRAVIINSGELRAIMTDAVTLRRSIEGQWLRENRSLTQLAPGGAGNAARPGVLGVGAGSANRADVSVTAMLDSEQFEAISAPESRPVLVLGSAGSGKTTVALHRLVRLATSRPEQFSLDRALVIVPEEGLARLSRRLLQPLGGSEARVFTLDDWAERLAKDVFGRALPPVYREAPGSVVSLKRHPALFDELRLAFANRRSEHTSFRRLHRRLVEHLSDREFLERVVARANGTLARATVEQTIRHTMHQIADTTASELAKITDPRLKIALDGAGIDAGTPAEIAGTVDIEDLPILLFLKAWRGELNAPPIGQLVIDEAEDFSLFELYVLGHLLDSGASVVLAGDEAQQTQSSFASWDRVLDTLGLKEAKVCRLSTSYRCPLPVAELAQSVLGRLAPREPLRAARGGTNVGYYRLEHSSQVEVLVVDAVTALMRQEPEASTAIIVANRARVAAFKSLFRDDPDVRAVYDGEFGFLPGVDVTHLDAVKGLEFDYVIVPDANAQEYPCTDESRHRLHVAVTRAAHQLWMLAAEPATTLIDWPA